MTLIRHPKSDLDLTRRHNPRSAFQRSDLRGGSLAVASAPFAD